MQVVRPAPQEVRKKDSKAQVLRQHEALSAMKRPRKITEKSKQTPKGGDRDDKDNPYDGAWQLGKLERMDSLDRQDSEDGATVSEEDEDEDDLDGVYPGLLEALSLHNFSDHGRSKRSGQPRGLA